MFKDNPGESIVGGKAVAVPGDLRGLEYLHNKYGVCGHSFFECTSLMFTSDYLGELFAILRYISLDTDFLVSIFAEGYEHH